MAFDTIPTWSTTAGSNTEIDGISLAENVMVPSSVNNAFREMMAQVAEFTRRGTDLASAATLNLDSIDTMFLDITGTTTVTAVTLTDGHARRARATGAFQLTASASLVVNGSTSTNYTTTAGDLLFFEGYGSSVVRVWTVSGGSAVPFTAASASGAASLLFAEDTDNGTNKVTLQGPASIASDITVTLPSAAGTLGIITPWVTYTPTFTGFGTPSNVSIWSRRVGDTLELRGKFTCGTSTGTEGRISLGFNGTDGGITSDATKVASIQRAGALIVSSVSDRSLHVLVESAVGYVTFSIESGGRDALTKVLGSDVAISTNVVSFNASIPISGW